MYKLQVRGGWQRGLEPSLHDRTSQEIWPSETEYQLSFKTNMAENANMEGTGAPNVNFRKISVRKTI